MSILHGSWIVYSNSEVFFVWGETWRSLVNQEITPDNNQLQHPFCLNSTELVDLLRKHQLIDEGFLKTNIDSVWTKQSITIPSQKSAKGKDLVPIFSQNLTSLEITDSSVLQMYPWQVSGLSLTPEQAVAFFQAVPLNNLNISYLGADISFWHQIYRWVLDLINRGKFLPGVEIIEDKSYSIWQPLLDSDIDLTRLAKFSQLMPEVCLAYNQDTEENSLSSQELLLQFLAKILDVCLRNSIEPNINYTRSVSIAPWLRSLATSSEDRALFTKDNKNLQKIQNALYNWSLPIQEYLVNEDNKNLGQNSYRVAFSLEPPVINKQQPQGDWELKYYLQALDDSEFLVDSQLIWQNTESVLHHGSRIIEQAQEILLKGLGLAARIYSPMAESLEQSNPINCQLNPIQVYEFLRSIAWQLQNNGLGVILPPGLASGENEQRLGVRINAEVIQKKGERLSLKSLLKYKLSITVGDTTISKKDFEKLLEQQSPIVEINGKWLSLQPADVRASQAVLNQSNEQLNLSVEDALRLSTGDTKTLVKLPVVKFEAEGVLQELISNLTENKSVEAITNIEDLNGTLRPYQARGVGWLAFLEKWSLGACLADDMGLGKTLQLISFILHLKNQDLISKPTLVICPTSVLNNWEREVKKFAPTLSAFIHHGDTRSKGKTFINEVSKKHIVITSYSLVHRDSKTLNRVKWQGIVLDEAQNIKNPSAKQSQAVRQIPADFRIALTGTPVENRLSELWSILDFLNPGFLGNRTFFQKRFANPIEKYGDRDSLNILRSLVQPFILRRLKTDKNIIQDLPEKQEMNVFCGLSEEQAEFYQKLVDESLIKIEESEGIKRHGLILTLLLRLKQLCNHPLLISSKTKTSKANKLITDVHEFCHRSGKLMRLTEMLDEIIQEGNHALIFTQFSEWGKLLKFYLENTLNQEVFFLYGATRRQQRQEMIDRFQHDPNAPQIFILSLKAGGTGLNLTRANHVFHVDRWWNPAVENQATDRAFRIGQKRNVQVHKFVCSGTLEERINDIIESKQELAEQTIDAGEQWLTKLDTNQLRSLLLLDRDSIIDEDT
ncbi:MAG: DEAD/DEAH box helicase [Xenococcaceae cyanobacterium MO_167.B27]|nr:DEAD/DEAH box helicase [Xenococcaceae cyanobacterium MO_167.B27]